MKRPTQQQCIDTMQSVLDYRETSKTSVWDFRGKPDNFIDKARHQGLDFLGKHNDDLFFKRNDLDE